MSIGCVIFDLDGTLVDSEILSGQAFAELLPELGEDAEEMAARYRGVRFSTILRDLEDRLDRSLPTGFEQIYRARVAELFDAALKPMPGAAEMLAQIALPCCVASNGPLPKMRHALKRTNLARFFDDRLYSAYSVGLWKPDPGLFLHAAAAMGVAPASCLVVDDTWLGIDAAMAAGMVPVKYGGSPDSGRKDVRIVADLRDLTRLLPA